MMCVLFIIIFRCVFNPFHSSLFLRSVFRLANRARSAAVLQSERMALRVCASHRFFTFCFGAHVVVGGFTYAALDRNDVHRPPVSLLHLMLFAP